MGIGDGVGDAVDLQPGNLSGTPTSVDDPITDNTEQQLMALFNFVGDNAIWIVLLSSLFIKSKTVLALIILTLVVFVNHKADLESQGDFNDK